MHQCLGKHAFSPIFAFPTLKKTLTITRQSHNHSVDETPNDKQMNQNTNNTVRLKKHGSENLQ